MSVDCLARRREAIADRLHSLGKSAVIFEDREGARDNNLSYLSGHPMDAVFIVFDNADSALIAWDHNLAKRTASVSRIIDYNDFGRNLSGILAQLDKAFGVKPGSKIELPLHCSHNEYVDITNLGLDYLFDCGAQNGVQSALLASRAIKDADELDIYKQIWPMTNQLIFDIEKLVKAGKLAKEMDIALWLEAQSRKLGCQGMAFDTICAGPSRSSDIHAYPNWTSGDFGTQGLSILDFGLRYKGYCSDVTITIAREPLNHDHLNLLRAVENAYTHCKATITPGNNLLNTAHVCQNVFEAVSLRMPHSLGHGLGLDAHEMPTFRLPQASTWNYSPGMVFTLEPGLYVPRLGGVRLENDFVCYQDGCEQVTDSKIVYI